MRNPLVIGCGALAEELVQMTRRAGLPAMDLTCLPASLHNRPEQIPARVRARIRRARADGYDRIFVAYADCGTGGLLDPVLEAEGVARLEGAHCYEVYAGRAAFATLHDEEPGTFYLTDYLVRNFDRLVIRGLGLDRHPELLPVYFGNYHRLVYLAQTDDAALTARAEAAAMRLGDLAFERRLVGLGELAPAVAAFARSAESASPAASASPTRPAAAAAAAITGADEPSRIAGGERVAIRPADQTVRLITRVDESTRMGGPADLNWQSPGPFTTGANQARTTRQRQRPPLGVSA
ncbi:MAG TPA: DUF1638 domain-containing protein [Candidatus Limnocylindrales bacterium]|nr:DUF1638 domain-containing protein [Candidatus Limnocylindrales bacterium]